MCHNINVSGYYQVSFLTLCDSLLFLHDSSSNSAWSPFYFYVNPLLILGDSRSNPVLSSQKAAVVYSSLFASIICFLIRAVYFIVSIAYYIINLTLKLTVLFSDDRACCLWTRLDNYAIQELLTIGSII